MNNIETSKKISKIIKNLGVGYIERGDSAFYNIEEDEITLPEKYKFIDKYSYYATQLHEICHSTGHINRLNRNMNIKNNEDRAREELIAEISSSFLMVNLNVNPKAEHYENHKSYIQSWISILENNPNELFRAINESNNVCKYIREILISKNKKKEMER